MNFEEWSEQQSVDDLTLEKAYYAGASMAVPSACEVCWTVSWQPCEEDWPNAIKDSAGGYMFCLCCWQHDQIDAKNAEIKQLASDGLLGILDNALNPSGEVDENGVKKWFV